MDHDHPAVVSLPLPPHQSVLFQIVDHQRDIPAAPQQLFSQRALAHGPQVQQRLENAELPHGQALRFELHAESGLKRVGSPREIDKSVERALRFR